jgi:S-disulfanyl-L-cysteine oxidoreductase SoxD
MMQLSGYVRAICVAGMVLGVAVGSRVLSATAQTDIFGGVYTEEQATRGGEVYQSYCAFCHGEDLAGSEMGPILRGNSFLEFWEGLSLSDLLNVIQTSMPQDNPGGLQAQEYVDVLAYILQKAEYPTGSAELPADGSGLDEIQIQVAEGE